jgi:hypothetical protein
MPIEIRELVIRTVVDANAEEPGDDSVSPLSAAPRAQGDAIATQAVVQECVRQVLRILERKQDR